MKFWKGILPFVPESFVFPVLYLKSQRLQYPDYNFA